MSTTPNTISTVPVPPGVKPDAGAPLDFSSIAGHVKHAADDVAQWYMNTALGKFFTQGPDVAKSGAASPKILSEVAAGKSPEEAQVEGTPLVPGADPEAPWNKPFAQFRGGLNKMSEDMHKFADTHASQLNPGARALLHGVATAMEQAPVGSSALETAAMIPFGKEPEEEGLGKGKGKPKDFSAIPGHKKVEPPAPRLGPGGDFYSPLEHFIATKLPEKMSGEQLLNTLRNAPGISKAELEASGIEDLAREPKHVNKLRDSITRDEVLSHVQERTPHVETVEKSANVEDPEFKAKTDKHVKVTESLKSSLRDELGLTDQQANGILENYSSYAGGDMGPEYDTLTEKITKVLKHKEAGALPTDLTAEEQNDFNKTTGDKLKSKVADWVDEHSHHLQTFSDLGNEIYEHDHGHIGDKGPKYESYTLPGGSNYREVLLTLPAEDKRALSKDPYEQRAARIESQEDYSGPHFDEPNVVAHLRLKDRTDANGKKTLFVEELQSDWARELREQKGIDEGAGFPSEEAAQRREEGGVPNMPFDKSWHELALKKILDLAAKEGYDQIAWTPGKVQEDRYPGEHPFAYHLYDEMVPQFLNRYTKKWGGKVGEATFKGIPSKTGLSPEGPRTVQALPITPEMRDAVKRGQPLFGGGNLDFTAIPGHVQRREPGDYARIETRPDRPELKVPKPSPRELADIRKETGLPLSDEAAAKRIRERAETPVTLKTPGGKFTLQKGTPLYHTTTEDINKLEPNRITWFTPDKEQARGYRENSGGKTLAAEFQGGRIATEKDWAPIAKEVFKTDEPIYSMFDENVGEFDKKDVRKFIQRLKDEGYDGASMTDYSSLDNRHDAETVALFNTERSTKLKGEKEAGPQPSSEELADIKKNAGLPLSDEAAAKRVRERTEPPKSATIRTEPKDKLTGRAALKSPAPKKIEQFEPGDMGYMRPDGSTAHISVKDSPEYRDMAHQMLAEENNEDLNKLLDEGGVRYRVDKAKKTGSPVASVQIMGLSDKSVANAKKVIEKLPTDDVIFESYPTKGGQPVTIEGTPKEVLAGINRHVRANEGERYDLGEISKSKLTGRRPLKNPPG